MSDRGFTHPNFGNEVRVEQYDKQVHLVFVADTQDQSDSFCEMLLMQLKAGAVNLTLMGKPTDVVEE